MAAKKHKQAEAERHVTKHKPVAEHAAAAPTHHEKPKEIKISIPEIKGFNLEALTTAAAILLAIIVTLQAVQTFNLSRQADELTDKAAEAARLPAIEVTTIDAECAQCTPVAGIMAAIESSRANVTRTVALSRSDPEAAALITKYKIARLPTAIVTGETAKVSIAGFTAAEDALVYAQAQPPYFDTQTEAVKGVVSLTYINVSSCNKCSDLMPFVRQLTSQVRIGDFKTVDKDSQEGQRLVNEFSMARLPGILVSKDINEYELGARLAQAGTAKKDGTLALGATAPYLNVSTGKISGITQVTLLNDSTCPECYDVTMHVPIIEDRFGVYTESTRTVDVASAEGKQLASKYSIVAVPTIIITGDAAAYDSLNAIWPTVGTVEKDGTYVFRTMSQISGSVYKNLTSGKVESR